MFYCIQKYICNEERAFLIFLLSFQIISSALNTFAVKQNIRAGKDLSDNLVQRPRFINTRNKALIYSLSECPPPKWPVAEQGAASKAFSCLAVICFCAYVIASVDLQNNKLN